MVRKRLSYLALGYYKPRVFSGHAVPVVHVAPMVLFFFFSDDVTSSHPLVRVSLQTTFVLHVSFSIVNSASG